MKTTKEIKAEISKIKKNEEDGALWSPMESLILQQNEILVRLVDQVERINKKFKG